MPCAVLQRMRYARPALFTRTGTMQNGLQLLHNIHEWTEDALCTNELKAGEAAAHLMLDCEQLPSSCTLTLKDACTLMDRAPAPAAPEASARVAVPLQKQFVFCVKVSTAETTVPQEHHTAIHRRLVFGAMVCTGRLCAQSGRIRSTCTHLV